MSRQKGFLGLFSIEKRRKFAFFGAGFTTLALFAGNYLPHTIFLEKYREIVQCYSSGLPRQVPDKLIKRINNAFDKLELHSSERKLIKPFTVYGFDIFSAGSTKQKFGAILGIPVNYSYDSVTDINKQEIRFRNELINWNSESGKLLEESIVLTEDEQIFGLCKSILQLKTNYIVLNSLFPSSAFFFVYAFGNKLNERLNLLARPLSLRLVMYSILGLFGLGTWIFAKDFNQVRYDIDIDKTLCELGPEFIEAGIRFYDKLLKKNMALRGLIGDNTYTVKGNENYFLRQKSMPLTLRKSFFEMRMEEIKKQLQEKMDNPDVNL